MLRLEVLSQL